MDSSRCRGTDAALALMHQAREALNRGDWATVFDCAGKAILVCSGYREPYFLIGEACFMQGDAVMGEAYSVLAEQQPRRHECIADGPVYDPTSLGILASRWQVQAPQTADQDAFTLLPKLRMAAGGDILLARQMPERVEARGADAPLQALAPMFRVADLTLAHLGTCVSTEGDYIDKGGRQPNYYRCLPQMLEVLAVGGIRCLATGNDHAMDFGPQALVQQIDVLDACGFLHFGSGRRRSEAAMPQYVRANETTVAFIGCTTEMSCMAASEEAPGVHHVPVAELASVLAGSIAVARAHADLVIVSPRWGTNQEEPPSPELRDAARRLIDLGADAILGHSGQMLQGIEMHAGRPIVYGMGTLLFDRVTVNRNKESALFGLEWTETGACRLSVLPLSLGSGFTQRAVGEASRCILERLRAASLDLDPLSPVKFEGIGLRLEGRPFSSPVRRMAKRSPARVCSLASPPRIPVYFQQLKSNLVYPSMPVIEGVWPAPVRLRAGLEVLGARYASPVRPGMGFLCEVYFRSAAPEPGCRIEAILSCIDENGVEQFHYSHLAAEGMHPPARWSSTEVICDRFVVHPQIVLPEGRYRLHWSLIDVVRDTVQSASRVEGRRDTASVDLGEWVVTEAAPSGVGGIAPAMRLPRAEFLRQEGSGSGANVEASAQRFASSDNPLLLSAERMALVTKGVWEGGAVDAILSGFSTRKEYLTEGSSGNIYLSLVEKRRHEAFDAASMRAMGEFAVGAAAAVVPKDATGLPDSMPLLRVDNVMQALERMGLFVRDNLFRGKRVLVSGTDGKTGFKHMLQHVLEPQMSTHAVPNSANLSCAILSSLASIRRNDRVAVIEAAGMQLAERSRIVRPHLAILTEVGNEHQDYYGSQQGVIEANADIVLGLVEGGYGILNADSANFAAVRKSALARRHIPLLLFGTKAGCNGRLLKRRFADGLWIVTAEIEGQKIEYRLPLLGDHAPLISVGALLASYCLGADVVHAAASLADYRPYWSEGILRRIVHRNGKLYCYDDTWKASVLSYRSALHTISRLEPQTTEGHRIGVIGEMTRLGKETEIWHKKLAEWVEAARFDKLILLGKHTEATYASLQNPDIVAARIHEYGQQVAGTSEFQSVVDAIETACTPGDLLFVKGELNELGEYLRAKEIQPDSIHRGLSARREDESAIDGLRRIDLDDLSDYRAAIDASERTSWQHYFPFMYLYDRTAKHQRILIGRDAGSLCVYRLRRRNNHEELSLYLLPLPFQTAVFERCIERVRDFNQSACARVIRVDMADASRLRHWPQVRCIAHPEEYVYAPAASLDMSGNKKGNLRRSIRKLRQQEGFEVLDYATCYATECRAVFESWATVQERKYGAVRYRDYTAGCLDHYDLFTRTDLFGKVIRLDQKICAFGFGGEMSQRMGNIFIVYSDLRIDGLSKCIYQCLLEGMQQLDFVNASQAAETPGLTFAKSAFGPAFLHRPYQICVSLDKSETN